jgi:hypothetical protein
MPAIDTISGFTTAAGAFPGVAITLSNSTLTVRNFDRGNAYLLTAWRGGQAAGGLTIRSPLLHDNVVGIRFQQGNFVCGDCQIVLPFQLNQRLRAQDTLAVLNYGSAVAGDIENVSLQVYYDELPGANARLASFPEVQTRSKNLMTLTHALVGGTAGVFGAAQALNAGSGAFKANTDYALLGYTFSQSVVITTTATSFGLLGVDTANLMIQFPCITSGLFQDTSHWFINMYERIQVPCIPIINAANAGGTTLALLNDENANTVTLSTLWAELS